MKTTLLVLIIFCAAAAFSQTAPVISNQVNVVRLPEHPQEAQLHPMGIERSLVGGASDTYSYAHGEIPLWEFGPVSAPVPLGDVARAFRQEKLTTKKAQLVFEKQGSVISSR